MGAAKRTDQLSEVLYKNGGACYLQLLASETITFQPNLIWCKPNSTNGWRSFQLSQVLGGGWEE